MKMLLTICCLIYTSIQSFSFDGVVARTNSGLSPVLPYDASIWGPITWNQPTNDLCLGWQARGSKIHFYLRSGSSTNRFRDYLIAPPGFQCVKLELYDEHGKTILNPIKSNAISNRLYKNLREVPKNKRGLSMGRLTLPPNSINPFAEVTITKSSQAESNKMLVSFINSWPAADCTTNIYQIDPTGKYTLIAKGQVMKINSKDQSLTAMELSSISLPWTWISK